MTAPIPGAPAPAPTPAPAPQPPAPVPAPAPAPQPANPAPAPQPTPTAPPVAPQPGLNGSGEPGVTGPGITFPAHTPWRDMSAEHQVAYWQHQARKHEQRAGQMSDYEQAKADQAAYQQLLTTTQTEHERAIAEARRQGEQTASVRANSALVEAYFRAAGAARGAADEDVTELLDDVNRDKFINAQGQVDTARIYALVNRLAGNTVPQAQPGVPAAPVAGVPAAPAPVAPAGWPTPPQVGPSAWPQNAAVPGQPGVPTYPGVPAAPAAWPGYVPAAPAAVGQMPPGSAPAAPAPGQVPDMGQGQFLQSPASGLEAGRAAARARHTHGSSSQSASAA
jgi:hypothetical protein